MSAIRQRKSGAALSGVIYDHLRPGLKQAVLSVSTCIQLGESKTLLSVFTTRVCHNGLVRGSLHTTFMRFRFLRKITTSCRTPFELRTARGTYRDRQTPVCRLRSVKRLLCRAGRNLDFPLLDVVGCAPGPGQNLLIGFEKLRDGIPPGQICLEAAAPQLAQRLPSRPALQRCQYSSPNTFPAPFILCHLDACPDGHSITGLKTRARKGSGLRPVPCTKSVPRASSSRVFVCLPSSRFSCCQILRALF